MKKVVFIFPNTSSGLQSRRTFMKAIKEIELEEITEVVLCVENSDSVENNIDIISGLQPHIIVFSNFLKLEFLAEYTTHLWKMYQDSSHKMHEAFYMLAYDNQELCTSKQIESVFKHEVHRYYSYCEDLIIDMPDFLKEFGISYKSTMT